MSSKSAGEGEERGVDEGRNEILAHEKHSCPACGGQARWDPGKRLLVCAYCGTEIPVEEDAAGQGVIREIPLVETLRELPEDLRGWKADRVQVKCQSCHAVNVFEARDAGKNCDFCGSSQLVPYEEVKAPITPESLLPFKITKGQARDIVKSWLGNRFWAPNNLKKSGLIDTVHGVYLPYWTFDAHCECPWTATSGDYYYVTRTRTVNGKKQEVRERKVRWYPSSGRVTKFFDDELVAASRGVDRELLRKIEPFPTTTDLVPYDTQYLSGWTVEHYQVVLLDAANHSLNKMREVMHRLAQRDVPGDTHKNLRIHPEFSRQTFKHVLLPVWLLTYDYGRRSYQVIVNGYTGAIAGRHPISVWKVAIAVVLGLIALLVLFLLFGGEGVSVGMDLLPGAR